ncbi:hypothetical protein HZA97_07175 [Candidatus Woesearchaeota archaeon]|nr:hypothetical protein [Candidatus Woesearchaeota archaeon]
MKINKFFFVLLIFLVLLTPVFAVNEEPTKEECSLMNIKQCIIDVVAGIFNLPLLPFIQLSLSFLKVQPNIDVFYNLWHTIIIMLSALYVLVFSASGLYLILKSDDLEGRIKAKQFIKNSLIVLMIIPASFYLYQTLLAFSGGLTNLSLNLVDEKFLYIDFSNITKAIEEILMYVFYLGILIITSLFLSIRYFFASIGVVFFPLGIFLYFIPFTKNYGKLILNLTFINLFIPFLASIILAGFSQLSQQGLFVHFETLLATSAFLTIDLMILIIALFCILSGINQSINFFKGGYEWVTTYHKN